MAPMAPITQLVGAGSTPRAAGRRQEIINCPVEAVLGKSTYQIRGVPTPTMSGTATLFVGDVVPVYVVDGAPVTIMVHNARRAPAVRRLTSSAPCVEELLYADGSVYFRNDQQLTALTAVTLQLLGTAPSQLVWGERDDTFCVVADMPVIGVRYFIFKLNRGAGQVLGSTGAKATLLDTLAPPEDPIELDDKYDSVNNSYENVLGDRYLVVTCTTPTFSGVTAITPVYLTKGLDVLAVVSVQAISQFSFTVLGLNTGRILGITQWLTVFSFKDQEMIWESPVSLAAEPLVYLGDCGDVSGPFDNGSLQAAANAYLPGEEPAFLVSGRILAWDESDTAKQLVALSVTKTLFTWSGTLSGGVIVAPGVQTIDSRTAATFIQDGNGTTIWEVLPYTNAMPTPSLAMSFKDVRVGPRSLRVLGITTIFDSDTVKEVNVLDLTKQTTRLVLDGADGSALLAQAIAPSEGALFVVDETSVVTGWPAASSRGHFAAPTRFALAAAAVSRDSNLEEFEGLARYPDAVTKPSGSGPRVAYHVVRTDDVKPLLPVLTP